MIKAWFDGACSDNGQNGPMGIGYAIYDAKHNCYISEVGEFGGFGTNNVAEYMAFVGCLKELLTNHLEQEEILLVGDSQLIIRQVKGEWKCKQEHLIPYRDEAVALMKKFKHLKVEWVRREDNKIADDLSKAGLSKKSNAKDSSEEVALMDETMEVYSLGDGIYKVESSSGNVYAVDYSRSVCSCPQNQKKHQECKHLKYIKANFEN